MSKLKHYKGDGWEVKVKYDEECRIMLWRDAVNHIPCPANGYYITGIVKDINKKSEGNYYIGKHAYDRLTGHLDTLTAPKILNEHTFDNPNFKIRIWETGDKIGAKTVWVKDGFKYNDINVDDTFSKNEVSIVYSVITYLDVEDTMAHFGNREKIKTKYKEDLNYTYSDLYQALERAEQETSRKKEIELIRKRKKQVAGILNSSVQEILEHWYDDSYFEDFMSNQTKEG